MTAKINPLSYSLSRKNAFSSTTLVEKILIIFAVFFILFRIPRVFNVGVLYYSEYTTRLIGSFSVTYVFTIFDLIAIFFGFLFFLRKREINVIPFILVLFTYNGLRFIARSTNIFDLNSFEIVFSLLIVLSCGNIILYFFKTPKDLLFIFKVLFFACFGTQIIFALLKRTGVEDVGNYGVGYGCLGLSSGSLSLLYSLFILTFLATKEKLSIKLFYVALVFVGMVLTGSRANLLILLAFLFLFILFRTKAVTKLSFIAAIIIIAFGIFVFEPDFIFSNYKIVRLIELFNGDIVFNIANDISIQERFESWIVAFKIIGNNPLGLSASANDLMNHVFAFGGITFPHSFLLSYFLLFGVSGLIVYFAYFHLLVKAIHLKEHTSLALLYLVIVLTFYGGISTEYLLFFWFYLFFAYCKRVSN